VAAEVDMDVDVAQEQLQHGRVVWADPTRS
jgi:hypothetical protein